MQMRDPVSVHYDLSNKYLARDIFALAERLRAAMDGRVDRVSECLQAIAIHYEESAGALSKDSFSRIILEEIVSPGECIDAGLWFRGERISEWTIGDPEESYILGMLLRNRISLDGNDNFGRKDGHFDPAARPPLCERVLRAVREKMMSPHSYTEQLDVLISHVAQFNELFDICRKVIEKHGLQAVTSKKSWIAGQKVDDLVGMEVGPVCLSSVMNEIRFDYGLYELVWQAQASADSEISDRIDILFRSVPEAFFTDARDLRAELAQISAECASFENWLLERSVAGIFRTEVMGEIDRLWPDREIARRAGRTTLDQLENRGILVRSKRQGRLHFSKVG